MTTVENNSDLPNKQLIGLNYSEFGAIAFLIIIYLVGTFGIGLDLFPGIVKWTPVNLLLSFIIAVSFHTGAKNKLLLFLVISFIIGLGLEIIGVQTGLVFGEYAYGSVLGPKILGTSLIIGINWAMLIYIIGSTINLFFSNWKMIIKCIYGTISIVLLDFIIEPVAIELGFWSWENEAIPFQNYIAWGVISFGLFYLFFHLFPKESNKVAYALFILQCVFFGLLNLFLFT